MGLPEGPTTTLPHQSWLLAGVLIAVGLIVYANCFQGEFCFDDNGAIVGNPHIQHLWPLSEALTAPRLTTAAGRPTVCLSMALNYALCGMNVTGYRAVNLAIHILCALALFGILRRTLANRQCLADWNPGANTLAFSAALIFLVHPLQTNVVNYITQRSESLMALFYLLTLYCAIRAWESGRSAGWVCASIAACALGMASKESMVSAPLIVLVYDRTFRTESFKTALRRSWLLYAGLAATWVILGALVMMGKTREGTQVGRLKYTAFQYFITQGDVIPYYLWLTIVPRSLCFDYGWPVVKTISAALPGLALTASLFGATLWALRRKPALGFLGLCFFAFLAPSSSIVPLPDPAVEYRMYLPLTALSVLYVSSLFWLATRIAPQIRLPAVAVWAIVLGMLSFVRNIDYHSDASIWADVVSNRPDNARGHANYAIALAREANIEAAFDPGARSKLDKALSELLTAQRLNPETDNLDATLGGVLASLGRNLEALPHLQAAVDANPRDAGACFNLANLLSTLGRKDPAAAAYAMAIAIDPNYKDAHYNLGIDLYDDKKYVDALPHFNEMLRIDPQSAEAHFMIGRIMDAINRPDEAQRHYQAAAALKPALANSIRPK